MIRLGVEARVFGLSQASLFCTRNFERQRAPHSRSHSPATGAFGLLDTLTFAPQEPTFLS